MNQLQIDSSLVDGRKLFPRGALCSEVSAFGTNTPGGFPAFWVHSGNFPPPHLRHRRVLKHRHVLGCQFGLVPAGGLRFAPSPLLLARAPLSPRASVFLTANGGCPAVPGSSAWARRTRMSPGRSLAFSPSLPEKEQKDRGQVWTL